MRPPGTILSLMKIFLSPLKIESAANEKYPGHASEYSDWIREKKRWMSHIYVQRALIIIYEKTSSHSSSVDKKKNIQIQ